MLEEYDRYSKYDPPARPSERSLCFSDDKSTRVLSRVISAIEMMLTMRSGTYTHLTLIKSNVWQPCSHVTFSRFREFHYATKNMAKPLNPHETWALWGNCLETPVRLLRDSKELWSWRKQKLRRFYFFGSEFWSRPPIFFGPQQTVYTSYPLPQRLSPS